MAAIRQVQSANCSWHPSQGKLRETRSHKSRGVGGVTIITFLPTCFDMFCHVWHHHLEYTFDLLKDVVQDIKECSGF